MTRVDMTIEKYLKKRIVDLPWDACFFDEEIGLRARELVYLVIELEELCGCRFFATDYESNDFFLVREFQKLANERVVEKSEV